MTKISRRKFTAGALGAGVAAMAMPLFSAMPTLAQTGDPKKGGVFKGLLAFEPNSVDPVLGNNPGGDGRAMNLFSERLLWQDEDGDYHPWLAEKYDESEDGTQITFTLREGIKFQDGTDFNADAVKFNLDRARTPSDKNRTSPYLTTLQSVEVVDPKTVKLHLSQRTGSFLAALSAEPGQIVSPKAIQELGDDFSRAPIGTGPFRLTSWTGGSIVADRWDGYWGKDQNGVQLPYLDQVVFTVVENASVQLVQMQASGAQWAGTIQPQDFPTVKADPKLKLLPGFGKTVRYSSFNNSGAPFKDNLKLRQAVSFAIDRAALAQVVAGDFGGPSVGIENPGSWATGPELKGHTFDPEKAKQLYAESGHTGPIVLSIIQRDPDTQVGQIIQAMCGDVGIQIQLETLERTAWVTKVVGGDFQMTVQAATTPQPDPDREFSQYYARTAATNYSKMNDDFIFDMVEKARGEADREKRRMMYIQIQQRILDQAYQTFLYWQDNFSIVAANVENLAQEWNGSMRLTETWLS